MQDIYWTTVDIPSYHSVIMNGTVTPVAVGIEPEFATIPNASRLIGLSRSTLYQLEAEGQIRFVRVLKEGKSRGRVLVDLKSLRQFLTSCAGGIPRRNNN
jgi:hypothetical protein